MPRSAFASTALGALLFATPVAADAWFDIGGGQPVTIFATGAPESWEYYPPYPFGPSPPGSLVFEDVSVVPSVALSSPEQISGPTRFIRGFTIYFYGLSCGCGGALAVPTQLRFGYDPALVQAAGTHEADLKLLFNDEDVTNWTLLPAAVVDQANHWITVKWDRNVLGWRQFAILTHDVTPVVPNSWGRLKALYRH